MGIQSFITPTLQNYYAKSGPIGVTINNVTNKLVSTDCLIIAFDQTFYSRNTSIASSSCV
jgi:hypothetical protein